MRIEPAQSLILVSRRAHVLRGNKSSKIPRFIIFFDTETSEIAGPKERQLILKMGCAVFRDLLLGTENVFYFKTIAEFWNFVFRQRTGDATLYFIAHNLPFDARVLKLFNELPRRNYRLYRLINAGVRNIWIFRRAGAPSFIFLDNMNIFTGTLEFVGHSIGLEKLEMPKGAKPDDLDLMRYCRRDVEIMEKAWLLYIEFLEKNDLGHFALTIAGQAFNAYRHRFMKEKIYIHNSPQAIAYERASYRGGRTEAFFIGKKKGRHYLLDVNSMYPSVMRENELPVKLVKTISGPDKKTVARLLRKYCVVADCLLDLKEPAIGKVHEGKLIFPIGRFSAVLTTREIEWALQHNALATVYKIFVYEKKKIFSEYVDFFYGEKVRYKKENNAAFSFMCKLFLNSLYGRFGMRHEEWSPAARGMLTEDGALDYVVEDTPVKERMIAGKREISNGRKFEGYDTFVAIPAHITGDARMKLWSIIKTAGRKNVFYCDTDSVIVNEAGYRRCRKLIDADRLGALGLKECADDLEIYGPKDYVFHGKQVIKGISKNAVKLGAGVFLQTRFEGFAGALRNNRLDKMMISPLVKKMQRQYKKARVLRSGTVEPYRLNESGRLF